MFAEPLKTLAFDDDCAEHYAVIRADLTARGTPIGPSYTLISAIAIAHGATLVTRNQREFQRVENLRLEVW